MRRVLQTVTLLTVFVALAPLARAGVYNLADHRAVSSLAQNDKKDARLQLAEMKPSDLLKDVGELRGADDRGQYAAEKANQTTSFRHRFLKQVGELEAKQKQGPLPVIDAINLSACYLRLGAPNRIEQARLLLEAALRTAAEDDPYRCLLLLNQAATLELTPEFLERAIQSQKEALAAWPKEIKGWSSDDLAWYRIAEGYYLKYLEARRREVQRGGAAAQPSVAPIFPKEARFDEPGWVYQAGVLPADTADALPMDALPIVAQLLLWLPNDNRVYWLYGELLNGAGFLADAQWVLDDLVMNRALRTDQAKTHRKVIAEAVAALPKPPPEEATPPPLPPPPEVWVPNWRQIGGSFFAGAVLAALAFWQIRNWARSK